MTNAGFGPGNGLPIHLDNVMCNGDEQSLLSCPSNEVGTNDCSHFEDAGVSCQLRMYIMFYATSYSSCRYCQMVWHV